MKWLLVVVLLLLVLAAVLLVVKVLGGVWSLARIVTTRRRNTWTTGLPQPRCLNCRGTGWIDQEPERTFNFVGDGFEDKHAPATLCPVCGGTGAAGDRGAS
ncbi:hypothetical protein [Actinoplanes sp. NBRC 103695]|uniref:hypothetical protein n=1 Tax=Actinoplanes sp. NBRC 103695 TaxID=3032202 RepID=UPI0024A2B1E9|nr:hypothetical protein [Actinoplanes sp. NBRC 103695]GLY96845.1 hypothetical protein Acsp02_40990 [Actinoplanes sp. NBRC 103695]